VGTNEKDGREERVGRNQALFRAVNEGMRELNDGFALVTEDYSIVCECADVTCTESVVIRRSEYLAVRENPRRFVVIRAHVIADVERIVSGADGYVVVEKFGEAAAVAEAVPLAHD
jgi:hypothetical protein